MSDAVVIGFEKGVFYATVPWGQQGAQDQLKAEGWHFHWGRVTGKCHPKCMACARGLQVSRVWYTPDVPKAAPFRAHFDDDAEKALSTVESTLEASRATDSAIEVPVPKGLAYFGFQRAGIAWLGKRKSALLGDEQGVGKTIQAIGAINADPAIRNVLVLAPASLLVNWKRELVKWSVRPIRVAIPKTSDGIPPLLDPGSQEVQAVIANYEKLVLGRGKSAITAESIWDVLMGRRWDLLIVDEAHRLRNPKAGSTQAVFGTPAGRGHPDPVSGLVHRAYRKWLLSGTPVPSRPIELWPMLSSLAPATFHNFFGFTKRYCAAVKVELGSKSWWDFSGASNLEELQATLRSGTEHTGLMIRRLKADVLPDLPPKIRHLHVLEPSVDAQNAIDAEWKKYQPLQEQIDALRAAVVVADLRRDKDGYEKSVAALEKAEQVAFNRISAEREGLARVKAPMVAEHIKCLLDGGVGKVIVFGVHYVMLDTLAKELAEYGVVQLDGRTPQKQRMLAVDKFQADPACRVFVGNVQAAGVGLTLTASSTVVMSEASWVPGDNAQCEDRAHRVGATADCVFAQYLVLDGSLDQHVLEIVVAKMAVQDAVLDRRQAPVEQLTLGQEGSAPRTPRAAPAAPQAPVYAPEIREAAHRAVRMLAARCDGAMSRDGVGFGGQWVSAGHWLASETSLGDRAAEIAIRIAHWHQRQLPADLLASLGIEQRERKPRATKPKKRPGYDDDNKPA